MDYANTLLYFDCKCFVLITDRLRFLNTNCPEEFYSLPFSGYVSIIFRLPRYPILIVSLMRLKWDFLNPKQLMSFKIFYYYLCFRRIVFRSFCITEKRIDEHKFT